MERQAAAQQAAAQQEAARRQAAQAEASRLEAERQEGERQAAAQQAAQQEASRQQAAQAAQAEAARVRAERQAAEAQREERLRAIGRQLNEEADRRDAAAAAANQLPYSLSTARRARLFGRSDPNADLILYAEAWARKIQMNMTIDLVREAARQPHTQPVVTVAIRSDGTVESVTMVRTSGVAAIDEAIERIVRSQANYPAFSPALARQYDVVEIRRTWHFDVAVRLD
jgi:TonB family protein